MGSPPGLNFLWILLDLGTQLGAKLGGKIEPRQAKTGQDKGRQGKRREGKGKEEEGKGLEGKGVEKCGIGDSAAGGEGFTRPLGGDLPRAPDPLRVGTLELLIATFWPSCCPSFFHRFFDAIFDRSWLDFRPQLGSQNPPKSIKNRCQDAFPC